MLNKFCFHVYAQKSMFIAENCNAFFYSSSSIITLSCVFRVHRAQKSRFKVENAKKHCHFTTQILCLWTVFLSPSFPRSTHRHSEKQSRASFKEINSTWHYYSIKKKVAQIFNWNNKSTKYWSNIFPDIHISELDTIK